MIQYKDIVSQDIITRCYSLLGSGDWYIDPKTTKITPKNIGIGYDTPWVHVNRAKNRGCAYWTQLFKLTKVRAKRCYSCWKVVIRMDAISDLIRCYDYMAFDIDHPCKCGWDERPYTTGMYAGYFYCESKEMGLDILEKVREELKPVFKHENSITLKRGCTEFEMHHGPEWGYTPYDEYTEQLFLKNVDIPETEFDQPDIVKTHVMRKWMEDANRYGDKTVAKFNGGNMLSPQLKNYEE